MDSKINKNQNHRQHCPICIKDTSKSTKFFTPKGLKQHKAKVHGFKKEPVTTIEVTVSLHDAIEDLKKPGESFDGVLRRFVPVPKMGEK